LINRKRKQEEDEQSIHANIKR